MYMYSVTIHKVLCMYLNIGPDNNFYKRKIVIIFLPIDLDISFGCSKEPSH